jgi:rifampin ADP-ribosylating transferase
MAMTGMMPTGLGDDALELAYNSAEPRDPHTGRWIPLGGGGWEGRDRALQEWFHPQQLEAIQVKHPRSGWPVNSGLSRRVTRPPESQHGNESLGIEGPPTFDVIDHGDPYSPSYNSLKYMNPQPFRTEPIQHVYRGISEAEWQQAQRRGYLASDRRGTISELEGTNAAVDPTSAVSYLPREGPSRVVKIEVRPEDKWFTIRADDYLRTRQRIPVDRVRAVSPPLRATGGWYEQLDEPATELAAWQHEPRDPATGEWYHGTDVVLQPGDLITPGRQSNYPDARVRKGHVYYTDSLQHARQYAGVAAYHKNQVRQGSAEPHIYQVEPADHEHAELDESATTSAGKAYLTRKPLRVIRQVESGWNFSNSDTCPHCGCPADGLAIQLGEPAFLHELRIPKGMPGAGEWVRSAVSTQVIPGAGYSKQQLAAKLDTMIKRAPHGAGNSTTQNFRQLELIRAGQALQADDWRGAVRHLGEAAYAAEASLKGGQPTHGRSSAANSYRLLGQAIEEHYTQANTLGDRMASVNRAAAQQAPHWLGGKDGTEKWDGDVLIFDQANDPSVAASMGWHGEFSMSDGTARSVRDILDSTGPVQLSTTTKAPAPELAVGLHELIHGVEAPLSQAHDRSGRTPRDDEILRLANLVRRIEETSGRTSIASLANINLYRDKGTPEITEAELDDLVARGFLQRSGKDHRGDQAWLTSYLESQTAPAEPGADTDKHQAAYRRYRVSRAEEGFTELGTVHHMPQWLESVGLADRPTTVITVPDPAAVEAKFSTQAMYDNQSTLMSLEKEAGQLGGKPGTMGGYTALTAARYAFWRDPMDKVEIATQLAAAAAAYEQPYPEMRAKIVDFMHTLGVDPSDARSLTLGEYADQIRTHPARVASDDAWGHYGWETRAAQAWVNGVARFEGLDPDYPGGPGVLRAIELSDEVNREGAAGKFPAMARQIMRAMGVPDNAKWIPSQTVADKLTGEIEAAWPVDSTEDPVKVMTRAQELVNMWKKAPQ